MYSLKLNHNTPMLKIKSDVIIQKLSERNYKICDAELRLIFGHIRRNNLCAPGFILADSGGYWYSEDMNEMKTVWKTEYGRALKIMQNFAPLHKLFKHLEDEQGLVFEFKKITDG